MSNPVNPIPAPDEAQGSGVPASGDFLTPVADYCLVALILAHLDRNRVVSRLFKPTFENIRVYVVGDLELIKAIDEMTEAASIQSTEPPIQPEAGAQGQKGNNA